MDKETPSLRTLVANPRAGALALAALSMALMSGQTAEAQAFAETRDVFSSQVTSRASGGKTCFGRLAPDHLAQAVVLLVQRDGAGRATSSGSGTVVLGREGERRVLTAAHVVQDSEMPALAYDSRGHLLGEARVLASGDRVERPGLERANQDVALLEIVPSNPVQALRLSAIRPLDVAPPAREGSPALRGWTGDRGVPAAQGGMSGGPVLDSLGRVAGVVHSVTHGLSPDLIARVSAGVPNALAGQGEEGFSPRDVVVLRRSVLTAGRPDLPALRVLLAPTPEGAEPAAEEAFQSTVLGYGGGACLASTGRVGPGLDPFSRAEMAMVANVPRGFSPTPERLMEAALLPRRGRVGEGTRTGEAASPVPR